MEDILSPKTNNKNKAKKIAGLIVGLSLAQAGGIVIPAADIASVVQAAQQEFTSEELAEAVAQTLEELDTTVDKSALNDIISQAQKLDTSSSDDASVAQLQKAIASAVQVSNNEKTGQAMVDRHIQLLKSAAAALYGKTEPNTVYDGIYQISGNLMHASADQDSMGNAALQKPFKLVKDGDNLYLRIECTPLTTKLCGKNFTGYLAEFYYYPGWTDEINPPAGAAYSEEGEQSLAAAGDVDDFSDDSVYEGVNEEASEGNSEETSGENSEENGEAEQEVTVTEAVSEEEVLEAGAGGGIAATVESYYDNYDSYNDPQKGTDANVKGKKYPHYINIPVELNQTLLWTQVYVPVMESISAGGGRQFVRLILDWNSLKQVSGPTKDKSALLAKISEVQNVLNGLQKDSQGFTAEQIAVLSQAITTAQAVDANMNVNQGIVDCETDFLTKAINLFSSTKVDSDKSELKKAMEEADVCLNEQEVTYSQASLDTLRQTREKAQLIYDNDEATQTQVDLCVKAINQAIQGLVIEGGDRRQLKKALTAAETILKDKDSYTAAAYQTLKNAYDQAKSVYSDTEAEQTAIDDQTDALNYVIKNMKKVSETKVDRSGLYEMIKTATGMAAREDLYTEASIKTLKSALDAAEAVYQKEDATQSEVSAQITALSKAVSGLSAKPSSGNSNSSNNNGSSSSSGDSDSGNTTSSGLDVNNLADGVYSVTGTMLKTDKATASMSNDAINHTVKLTVKNGKYTLTLDFKGLTINDQLGYLGKLKYYKTGYTLDKYNSPKGSLGSVTIDSYQKYENGKKVSDSFGTDYPDVVSFPMISEAKKDGYVPLQVFVPIMDSISKGTGTQPVYLKLDWSSLKKTDNNDSSFKDTTTNTKSTSSGSGSSTTTGSGSNLNTMSTTSKLGGSSLAGSNASLTTNSSLAGGSSLKTSATSLKSGTSLTGDKKKSDSKTLLESAAVSAKDGSLTGTGSVSADASDSTASKDKKDLSKVMVPSVLSALAALAGILYKLKSRMGL